MLVPFGGLARRYCFSTLPSGFLNSGYGFRRSTETYALALSKRFGRQVSASGAIGFSEVYLVKYRKLRSVE